MTPTSFRPSTNGFRFGNSWPHGTPVMRLPGPFPVTLGDANSGLCGGIALAAADLFRAGRAPAAWPDPPVTGTPGFAYLRSRLFASWDLPTGAARFAAWSLLPDADTFFGIAGVGHRTIDQLTTLRTGIDRSALVLLGVVTVRTANPIALGKNHIVLAYGYDATPTAVTVFVYDPNSPRRDDIRITVDTTTGGRAARITHNVHIELPIRGLFVLPTPLGDPTPVAAP